MIRVLTVMGTRPEGIKLAPVVREFQKRPGSFECILCETGQHREMLDQVVGWFGLKPRINLALMTTGQDLSAFAGRALAELSKVIEHVEPQLLIVQGDTTTAMAGALAAAYRKIPVAHVEAGLRTDTLLNPFPEEINRRLISVVTRFHFTPTKRSADALLRENVPAENIIETGNTVIDALRITLEQLRSSTTMPPAFVVPDSRRILVTTHRRESFGEPMHGIFRAIRRILERNPDVEMLFPVHLNPNVRKPAFEELAGQARIRLTEPLSYERFVQAMDQSDLILTDSGGVQEEAPFLGKPVLVMRDNTERIEAIDAGTALLVGTDPDLIVAETERLLHDRPHYERMARVGSPFGDGHAAARIVDHIEQSMISSGA